MGTSNQDLVSIITPTYNSSNYICSALQSVMTQTFQNWELIIIDDCSYDDTLEKVKKEMRGESRIKVIQLQENKGPAYARNIGIAAAKGNYLAFLDSDDIWLPQKLERQLKFMKKNHIAFSYTSYRIISEKEGKAKEIINIPPCTTYHSLLKNTAIGTLTVMLDTRQLGMVQMPLYRDCSEDFGLWLSILSKGIYAYGLDEELAIYRKREHSLSGNKLKSAKKTWNTYRKVEKINFASALWYFANYSFNALKKHSLIS
ncbi:MULTISPECIES: glycosyltransferase family 2 protein [unclassified Cytobacillus]|jgi:teichuronic acid biosynthesis glycosyltransferase TuaG|uniref:glycosyltransferase family 2 protein n=1 Tax=unclassified Cytobacillus TaxID=2675268 RepID=UPI0013585C65|nr:glycosyltransferase family 2 protein [Cytobacillus sp. AMY 15.2]KAF0815858.1 Beta-1,3-glucosyltransferase [Bacillus sp. ZZV12-4809]MCM3094451.1 glycosyltransferase [Cytobacillus sp. AMY 15.2]